MRKSWKPQVRSFFINSIPFWIFLGIVSLGICYYFFYIQNQKAVLYTILVYFGMAISDFYYVKRWNFGGYEKITVDTDKRLIIFDDRVKIHFKDIVNIEYTIENNPNIPLLFRKDIYDNGRIDLFKINATLFIQTTDGKFVKYSIQNKSAAKGILKILKTSGFNIEISDERTFNLALFIRVLIVVICLIALAFIHFNK